MVREEPTSWEGRSSRVGGISHGIQEPRLDYHEDIVPGLVAERKVISFGLARD